MSPIKCLGGARGAGREAVRDAYVLALLDTKPLLDTKQQLLDEAAALDAGFDPRILAEMMAALDGFRASDIAVAPDKIAPLRQFFHDWSSELE